jgi:hypothetical protein
MALCRHERWIVVSRISQLVRQEVTLRCTDCGRRAVVVDEVGA